MTRTPRTIVLVLFFAGLTFTSLAAEPLTIQVCDRIVVTVDDPGERALGADVGGYLCFFMKAYDKTFRHRLAGPVRVRITGDMESWRKVSGRAWYISAVLRGDTIILQPGRSLRKLELPARPAMHELVHLYVRRTAGRGCPRWLDEGLAQAISGDKTIGPGPRNAEELAVLEARLRGPDRDRAQREVDYRAARGLVATLGVRVGYDVVARSLPKICRAQDPLLVRIGPRDATVDSMMFSATLFRAGEAVDGPLKR